MNSDTRPWLLAVATCLGLTAAGCSGPTIVESSATAVTVRYSGTDSAEEAQGVAQRACDVHHKSARLRKTANFGLAERYGHFDCV